MEIQDSSSLLDLNSNTSYTEDSFNALPSSVSSTSPNNFNNNSSKEELCLICSKQKYKYKCPNCFVK